MKNCMKSLVVIFFMSLGLQSVNAQETVLKEVLLTTLNSVNELDLSNLKTEELMEYNAGLVDRIYEILDSDKVEKDKVESMKILSNDTERDLHDLLGKKEHKKYVKLMDDALKPLIKKDKTLKYLF